MIDRRDPRAPGHVLLVGFMGSGKSTVGRVLAERLSRPFIDLDGRIAVDSGRSVAEIFADEGEPGFRTRESRALASLSHELPSVVACGGGVVLEAGNRDLLLTLGTVVYLHVTADEAMRRCGTAFGRPLLEGRDASEVAVLLAQREPLYADVADVTVDTAGLSAENVAEHVEMSLSKIPHERSATNAPTPPDPREPE